jgi:hypothetical protein
MAQAPSPPEPGQLEELHIAITVKPDEAETS